MGATCGAVTGAFMVIGLMHGKTKADDDTARETTYELANLLAERFKARNRSILCRELLGHDLGTDEGREAVMKENLFVKLCPGFVRDAVIILEEILRPGQADALTSASE